MDKLEELTEDNGPHRMNETFNKLIKKVNELIDKVEELENDD